ncbi:MAG: hypothetical protein JNL41_06775 [Phenylobacterium sp.]|uniref:hypothetical protein n=1 Tax=Phenylobacterium sp. TaxID=1871053 RepID=UPI001A48456D|nr:hypothetical protein [Phenylobacterium sp.]MBL8553965.1 hypothetical protein [Phenylobacterium sp.]
MDNEQSSLQRIITGERLLAIVRCLWKAPDHCANEEVISAYLRRLALYGWWSTTRTALDHLERLHALTITMHQTLMIAELTRRGADAAEGHVELDGVPKPGPECAY